MPDGTWFHTATSAHRPQGPPDESRGRKKESTATTGGKNVSPGLRRCLATHPLVANVVVGYQRPWPSARFHPRWTRCRLAGRIGLAQLLLPRP